MHTSFSLFLFCTRYWTNIISQQYNGPADIDYFQNISDLSTVDELSCVYSLYPRTGSFAFGTTDSSSPVHYYKVNITEELKSQNLAVTTCCSVGNCNLLNAWDKAYKATYEPIYGNDWCDEWKWINLTMKDENYRQNPVNDWNTYCIDGTLDTYLYVLYEKQNQINLISVNDDRGNYTQCRTTSSKSYIDLSELRAGMYIIGVGGYAQNYGSYFIQIQCSSPWYMTDKDFDLSANDISINTIECDDVKLNQQNTANNVVSYYHFSVTDDTNLPITISLCYPNKTFSDNSGKFDIYDTYIYVIKNYTSTENNYPLHVIDSNDDDYQCWDHQKSTVQSLFLDNGDYYAVVQGFNYKVPGSFNISMSCGIKYYSYPIAVEEISLGLIALDKDVVEIGCGTKIENEQHTPEREVNYYTFNITDDTLDPVGLTTCSKTYYTYVYIIQYSSLSNGYRFLTDGEGSYCDAVDITTLSLPNGKYYAAVQGYQNENGNFSTMFSCAEPPGPQLSKETIMILLALALAVLFFCLFIVWCCERNKMKRLNYNLNPNDKILLSNDMSGALLTDINKSDIEQFNDSDSLSRRKSTMVQSAIDQAIECCDDEGALDIYQMLAIFARDPQSKKMKMVTPFKALGINTQFHWFSTYYLTVFVVIIVAFIQTQGVTIVIFGVLKKFITEGIMTQCQTDEARWSSFGQLKLLAFLWSLVISFSIGSLLKGMQHGGLYKIIKDLNFEGCEWVNLWILQTGQLINYYACFWAVLGSYFIVFQTNEDVSDQDGSGESQAGLDMILNAVALFFMVEVDNIIVSDDDRSECKEYFQNIKKKIDNNIDTYDDNKPGKCFYLYRRIIRLFAVMVRIFCYVSGTIAPFFIFFCW